MWSRPCAGHSGFAPQETMKVWWGRGSPSVATSPMGTLCFCAMYPRKEKTTKPEEKLVRELMEVVMMASLREQDSQAVAPAELAMAL